MLENDDKRKQEQEKELFNDREEIQIKSEIKKAIEEIIRSAIFCQGCPLIHPLPVRTKV